ncbi:hypothetical protein STRTUCAR8_00163 [Streptomyces turgidiscabies Car8]|uniref:Lipoprotein n=1 Tax=Streptomyces turgidiscabies (strain Car8) TaxID=698760 RepID=L7F253_STRT8|nr:hypothetical protein STRTUCAR8_00163 [Streptomyces turgidiscabies Car8]
MRRTVRPTHRVVTMITAVAAHAALSGCTDAGSSARNEGGGKTKSLRGACPRRTQRNCSRRHAVSRSRRCDG